MTAIVRAARRSGYAVALVALAGCGGVKYYPVDGQLVYPDGTPVTGLAGGAVVMEAPDGRTSARGEVDAEGRFKMMTEKPGDGVAPGKQKVSITRAGDNPDKLPPRVIDAKYDDFATSGLEVDVEPKANAVTLKVDRPGRR